MFHTKYRHALPQLGQQTFLADDGLETDLVFNHDWDLPAFASFVLLESASGMAALEQYYRRYIDIATNHNTGLVLEAPTWRANPDWGRKIGYNPETLAKLNKRAIQQLENIRRASAKPGEEALPIVISGCIGPQDDGYSPTTRLTIDQARIYHRFQVDVLAQTPADMLCAMTITYVEEAIGIALAAQAANMPVAISFTVETDGYLPSGVSLADAIRVVDVATNSAPVYYMINCAHPTHFASQLDHSGEWKVRIAGVRANASCMSHAELDVATELDAGNPEDLGRRYAELKRYLPNLRVLGGCCGTDHRHIEAIAEHCF